MNKLAAKPVSAPSARSRVIRVGDRGHYDAATIHAILDAGYACHVAFVHDGQPMVIPTAYWREGNHLYIHGSTKSRMAMALATGIPASVAVTILDGLVLARSAFHHSMNYRSVVAIGVFEKISDADLARLDTAVAALEAQGLKFDGWATPGANARSAAFDFARVTARRAERRLVALPAQGRTVRPLLHQFVNRLSDLLWLFAREAEQ